ncbi:50S ribosomal protein L13 [Convivina intestini]|uniref:Large ribosomal subunit protein uL13 n=1 Tax=Convivina intestini TaxID=1505726 RepID=A0A2U1D6Z2_9LACO|nr:50S ribosomal protein L13 [Convivina intestini]PVY83447.1 LSU ribosomal protein L13P [Convivina intestini]CAH1855853.1 50S ribosomal protein L13 [Convivina intestini]SDC03274.1 LSU ribosomal protein L13P [Leuconostocaceae bacterium R-53105]
MRTTFLAKPGEIEKKWYIIDAKDVVMGRLSTVVASILRGKNKPTFTPNVDMGDNVIIINASEVKLTGKKATDKIYYHHSNHPGGLKERTAGDYRQKDPEKLLELSIKGMLPKNTLGRAQGLNLHVYAGADHKHAAQNPEVLDIDKLI